MAVIRDEYNYKAIEHNYERMTLVKEWRDTIHFIWWYVPPVYVIRFFNYDGTVLQESELEAWETPVYTGDTPTKPDDTEYKYIFEWWDPEITVVDWNKDYTAVYRQEEKEQLSWDFDFRLSQFQDLDTLMNSWIVLEAYWIILNEYNKYHADNPNISWIRDEEDPNLFWKVAVQYNNYSNVESFIASNPNAKVVHDSDAWYWLCSFWDEYSRVEIYFDSDVWIYYRTKASGSYYNERSPVLIYKYIQSWSAFDHFDIRIEYQTWVTLNNVFTMLDSWFYIYQWHNTSGRYCWALANTSNSTTNKLKVYYQNANPTTYNRLSWITYWIEIEWRISQNTLTVTRLWQDWASIWTVNVSSIKSTFLNTLKALRDTDWIKLYTRINTSYTSSSYHNGATHTVKRFKFQFDE